MTWSAEGIDEIGKMKPDRSRVGSIAESRPNWNATCCVSASVEMKIPQPRPTARKSSMTSASQSSEPRTGTSKSRCASSSETEAATNETSR